MFPRSLSRGGGECSLLSSGGPTFAGPGMGGLGSCGIFLNDGKFNIYLTPKVLILLWTSG